MHKWNAWLLVHGELRTLALFRVGWALAMLAAACQEAGLYDQYSSDRYHVPLVSWATPLGHEAFQTVTRIAIAGCLMTLVGLLPQLGVAAVVATLGYLFASDVLLFRNHIYLGLLLGLLLVVAPCARAFAIDAWLGRCAGRPAASVGCRAAVQLIKAQVQIVYAWSVINKLRVSFLNGWTLQQEMPYALLSSPLASWFRDEHGALRSAVRHLLHDELATAACSCVVVLIEALLVFGLPRRRWYKYAVCAGVCLHLSIFLLMNVFTFGVLMVSTYPLFRTSVVSRADRLRCAGTEPR